MKKLTILTLAGLMLTGCATQKELVVAGGSKADGTVELSSYSYRDFEVPHINEEQGLTWLFDIHSLQAYTKTYAKFYCKGETKWKKLHDYLETGVIRQCACP